ncbi:MAG: tRNA (adenosine(37)-N6)-threonylcarbamoyltransferase complex transferase subunit TsaD [Candidatus Shapirobacteria bacterium]|nr:tRNA (adenosine(37)-N6)-threonylcarbamoyltransferase complex transferase subunit TsaD [Candidatus Shapirobacteria bacterium]
MKILAIETSCDDTCAAVLENDSVLSNVISSQTDLHAKWGGVVPDIAKRAHESRINAVIAEAILRSQISNFRYQKKLKEEKIEQIISEGMKEIDVIGVTLGPGLAIALGIGVNKAKELAKKYNKKIVAVNHIEGHIWANFLKNKKGKPERELELPALALTVSGGHTKIILMTNPSQTLPLTGQGFNKIDYTVVGETLDDAAGEALDKAAKMLGLGYPGGPIIERLAREGKTNFLELPHPLADKKILDYSFSGLKTSFYYKVKDWPKEKVYQNLNDLAATFQNAVFETLLRKYKLAIEKYRPKMLLASGGVLANLELRKRLRKLAKEVGLPIFMPSHKNLNTDNAAMIGRVACEKAKMGEYVEEIDKLDRDPRLQFN